MVAQPDRVVRRFGLVAALIAIAVLVGACSTGTSSSGERFVSGDGSLTVIPPADRQPAPNITGETLAGEPFALGDYAGDVVALNVWASWCAPCRAEAPTLNQVAREYADQPVQFIGLDTRDTKAAADAFVRRFEVPYPNVWDPSASLQLQFRDTLPPAAIPSTVFVDQQGRVAARVLGRVERQQLRDVIDELLAEAPTPAASASS